MDAVGYQKAKDYLNTKGKWNNFLKTKLTAEQYALIYIVNQMLEIDSKKQQR